MTAILDVLPGIVLVLIGIYTMVTAKRKEATTRKTLERGNDHYFEQRRELSAYPVHRSATTIRRIGALMIGSGVLLIVARTYLS